MKKQFLIIAIFILLFTLGCSNKTTETMYEVSFNSLDGTEVTLHNVLKGSTMPIPSISRDGYTLDGWYTSLNGGITLDEKWSFVTNTVNNNLVLYAKWIINQYTITFDSNEGSFVNAISQDYNTSVNKPTNPTKEGYTFDGWYIDKELTVSYLFSTMPSENITLYAKWIVNQYSISFHVFEEDYNPLIDLPLTLGETITQVALGGLHSLAITSNGRVFTWGNNLSGQLGDGTTISKLMPIDITSNFALNEGEKINQVSVNSNYSSAVTSMGRVFTWGENGNGQLGDGTRISKSVPTDITSKFNLNDGETITQVSFGYVHSSAITSSGRIFTWGYNEYGEIGDGTTKAKSTPTDITLNFDLNEGETITQVALGGSHSSAMTSNGSIYLWGYNAHSQLGDGTKDNKIIPAEIKFFTPELDSVVTYNYLDVLEVFTPVREGYVFDGWYIDASLTIEYTFSTMPAEDIVLYGKWNYN